MSAQTTCLSGGARGSDIAWGDNARAAGHRVIHLSYAGHKTAAPRNETVLLTEEQLHAADDRIRLANMTLRRTLTFDKPWLINPIRRNWYQVRKAGSLYAVSTFERGNVKGGTGWAVQMFIDLRDGKPCPAYVFDQIHGGWHVWDGRWERIDLPPVPEGTYAGIGARDLNPRGLAAIPPVYRLPAPEPAGPSGLSRLKRAA